MTSFAVLETSRRRWLQQVAIGGAGCLLAPALRGVSVPKTATGGVRLLARLHGVFPASLPVGTRLPTGVSGHRLDGPGSRPKWDWSTEEASRGQGRSSRLRFTAALDFREERRIEVRLADSGTVVGTFDVRYAYAWQLFEISLDPIQTQAVLREGVVLDAGIGRVPLWIMSQALIGRGAELFAPHLLVEEPEPSAAEQVMLTQFASMASMQPFGWLEGCVLDGLQDLSQGTDQWASVADVTVRAHLDYFGFGQGVLRYEDLMGRSANGRFTGIESTLPMATVARVDPGHPWVSQVLAYWNGVRREDDTICGSAATAEGAYTVGWPLAVIAAQTRQDDLARLALTQVVRRIETLPDKDDLYLRYQWSDGRRTFRNWARAYAWIMLGMARVGTTLQHHGWADMEGMTLVKDELQRLAEIVAGYRTNDGLWNCFLDRPSTQVDTSGSAGIAAALAIGARAGLLPESVLTMATQARVSLAKRLTPDGVLSGVAQHNAGGEALQAGGYRVLSQMGMGLHTQLIAALNRPPRSSPT